MTSRCTRWLSMVCTDEETLTMTGPVFDGRCEYHRRAMLLGANPPEHRSSGLPPC